MYSRRDNYVCHICNKKITNDWDNPKEMSSLDHVTPQSKGGSDYPSNIKISHLSCNKSKKDKIIVSNNDSLNDSKNYSENDSCLKEEKLKEENISNYQEPSAGLNVNNL